MKVFLATDHAGFNLKEEIKQYLHSLNYEVVDCRFFLGPDRRLSAVYCKGGAGDRKRPKCPGNYFLESPERGRKSLPINLKMFGRFGIFRREYQAGKRT